MWAHFKRTSLLLIRRWVRTHFESQESMLPAAARGEQYDTLQGLCTWSARLSSLFLLRQHSCKCALRQQTQLLRLVCQRWLGDMPLKSLSVEAQRPRRCAHLQSADKSHLTVRHIVGNGNQEKCLESSCVQHAAYPHNSQTCERCCKFRQTLISSRLMQGIPDTMNIPMQKEGPHTWTIISKMYSREEARESESGTKLVPPCTSRNAAEKPSSGSSLLPVQYSSFLDNLFDQVFIVQGCLPTSLFDLVLIS